MLIAPPTERRWKQYPYMRNQAPRKVLLDPSITLSCSGSTSCKEIDVPERQAAERDYRQTPLPFRQYSSKAHRIDPPSRDHQAQTGFQPADGKTDTSIVVIHRQQAIFGHFPDANQIQPEISMWCLVDSAMVLRRVLPAGNPDQMPLSASGFFQTPMGADR